MLAVCPFLSPSQQPNATSAALLLIPGLRHHHGAEMVHKCTGSQFSLLPKCCVESRSQDWKCALRVLGVSLSDVSESPSWMGPGSPQSGFLGAFKVPGHVFSEDIEYSIISVPVNLKLWRGHRDGSVCKGTCH